MRLEFGAGAVQIDLLIAEMERDSPFAERLQAHAEAFVERDRRVDVGDGQDEVVEGGDAHTGNSRPAPPPSGYPGQLPLTTRLRRGGLMYSTRTTAARLCVVSSPGYGPVEGARRRRTSA